MQKLPLSHCVTFYLFIFLQHNTYINYIKVPFMGLSTYIA